MKQTRKDKKFLTAIKAGEDILDRGEGIPHEKVEKRIEAWLFQNPKTRASMKCGLEDAAQGKTKSLGSFAKYAKEIPHTDKIKRLR